MGLRSLLVCLSPRGTRGLETDVELVGLVGLETDVKLLNSLAWVVAWLPLQARDWQKLPNLCCCRVVAGTISALAASCSQLLKSHQVSSSLAVTSVTNAHLLIQLRQRLKRPPQAVATRQNSLPRL